MINKCGRSTLRFLRLVNQMMQGVKCGIDRAQLEANSDFAFRFKFGPSRTINLDSNLEFIAYESTIDGFISVLGLLKICLLL